MVTDIAAVRDELVDRGVGVSSIRHKDTGSAANGRGVTASGADPERADYASFADFTDPDGNAWIIQERGHRNRPSRPSVLVFDVNETLIDIESLGPHFEAMFGDRRVLREWFGQLVMYSMTVTLADRYIDFFSLGKRCCE